MERQNTSTFFGVLKVFTYILVDPQLWTMTERVVAPTLSHSSNSILFIVVVGLKRFQIKVF